MNTKVITGLGALAMAGCFVPLARAQQTPEVKEKPPIYLYISDFNVPRAHWADMDKVTAEDNKLLDRAVANGTIIGYGDDHNLIHQPEGYTHDNWWVGTSMAGVLNMLDQFFKSGSSTSPALASATKHEDSINVSRFYNWKPGTYKDIYTYGSIYKLKADAPEDALETLSKTMLVPLLEKLLADGAIVEYDIETQAIHTQSPGSFYIFITAANAEGLDKFRAARQEAVKTSPLFSPAFNSATDFTAHRDLLSRTNATFK
jgi:hypothetical protein